VWDDEIYAKSRRYGFTPGRLTKFDIDSSFLSAALDRWVPVVDQTKGYKQGRN